MVSHKLMFRELLSVEGLPGANAMYQLLFLHHISQYSRRPCGVGMVTFILPTHDKEAQRSIWASRSWHSLELPSEAHPIIHPLDAGGVEIMTIS